jgi:carboxymethylenebutenolidase
MRKYHKQYTYKVYPEAQHGFYNETTADRFHPEAAKEAWQKTLDLFEKSLKGPGQA